MTTPAFTIEIKAPELTAALTAIAAALGGYAKVTGTDAAPTETAEPEKPKRAPRAAKASEPETTVDTSKEPTSSSDEQTSSTDQEDAGSASPGLVYETDVRPKVLALVAKRGRDACTELLAQFARADLEPVANGKELLEGDWAEFIAKADVLIQGELA